jgi:hypothetical protein
MMSKVFYLFFCVLFIIPLFFPLSAPAQKADLTIFDFRVQALYRAAKLTWKAKEGIKSGLFVQVLRADTFEDGPYKEVTTIPLTSGKSAYEFVDKTMGAEAKYYYKLVVKGTKEALGPLPTRPFFSPPAT